MRVGLRRAARVAVETSALMPLGVAAVLHLGFPVALFAAPTREVFAWRHGNDLPVPGLLMAIRGANALFR